jgi:hypothetical protein
LSKRPSDDGLAWGMESEAQAQRHHVRITRAFERDGLMYYVRMIHLTLREIPPARRGPCRQGALYQIIRTPQYTHYGIAPPCWRGVSNCTTQFSAPSSSTLRQLRRPDGWGMPLTGKWLLYLILHSSFDSKSQTTSAPCYGGVDALHSFSLSTAAKGRLPSIRSLDSRGSTSASSKCNAPEGAGASASQVVAFTMLEVTEASPTPLMKGARDRASALETCWVDVNKNPS